MASSDSEDFESADEGLNERNPSKKERKKRFSSSNYSDSAQDFEQEPMKAPNTTNPVETTGWDDFDIEDSTIKTINSKTESQTIKQEKKIDKTGTSDKCCLRDMPMSPENCDKKEVPKVDNVKDKCDENQQDVGWDDFGDWGSEDMSFPKNEGTTSQAKHDNQAADIKSVADRLASVNVGEQKSWGWGGWGMDSLLSSATAGISSITSHVSQGISTVLESGIGAPNPEELAIHQQTGSNMNKPDEISKETIDKDVKKPLNNEEGAAGGEAVFPFGSLLSGVTKFVETTGTKVISGGLDTLETIGKKTMEVLQDGDPGLAKKRAMFGLDADKPVLSHVLKEAKTKADEEDRIREEKREAKQIHYETLFDDFEGLVHLEALEMLSKQVNMRIEDRMRAVDADKRQEIRETLQQVSELCELPDDDEEEDSVRADSPDAFLERLQRATYDLGLKLHFQPIVRQYTEVLEWLESTNEGLTEKAVYKRAVSGLAECTALCMELYHKAAEMLLVKNRRSTADEADALTQMTVVLTRHISELATKFTEKLNSLPIDNKEEINTYITNVFLEAGNSSTYIQNAFQLALPILQIGAA